MASRMQVYRPVVSDLPDDFGERIEEFRVASGLTVRALARLLGVSPYRLREWRRGVVPDSRHRYLLLMIAERMALRELLVHLGDDLPAEVERQLATACGGAACPPRRSLSPRGLGAGQRAPRTPASVTDRLQRPVSRAAHSRRASRPRSR